MQVQPGSVLMSQVQHLEGGTKGSISPLVYVQVQVQVYYVSERVHRPLDIMCCTWNVGNAQPPDELDQWLSGVSVQEHDLVAIGTCRGERGGGGRGGGGGGAAVVHNTL